MFPTYGELESFREIARLHSISRAAQSLGISQPSLSQGLKKLEERVGSALFIRRKTGVELTEAGRVVLAETDEMMALWKRTVTSASLHTQELSGRMRIGCHISVAQYALSPVLKLILGEFSRLNPVLTHDLSRRLVDQVIHNDLDLALAINPFRSTDLILRPVATDEVMLYTSDEHATIAAVQNKPLIVDSNLNQTQTILRKLYAEGARFDPIIETSSLEVCAAMLRDGVGASILPSRVKKLFAPNSHPVKGAPVFQDELKLVYKADRMTNPSVRSFMRRLEQVLKEDLSN